MIQSILNTFNLCSLNTSFKNEIKLTDNSSIYDNTIRINIPTLSINTLSPKKISEISPKNKQIIIDKKYLLKSSKKKSTDLSTNITDYIKLNSNSMNNISNQKEVLNSLNNNNINNNNSNIINIIHPPLKLDKKFLNECYNLKIINFKGNLLGDQKELIINPFGLKKYSIRNKKDGYTYFTSNSCYNNEYNNDYILNIKYKYFEENHEEIMQLFSINFDVNTKKYILNILHNNIKIFVKLKPGEKFCINEKCYFNIGEKYIEAFYKDGIKISILDSLNYKNNSIDYFYHIDYFNKNNSVIIGKGNESNIQIKNDYLSHKHCEILYDKDNNKFFIKDGFENKFSSNGTWLCINKNYILDNDNKNEYIKINNEVIKIIKFFSCCK